MFVRQSPLSLSDSLSVCLSVCLVSRAGWLRGWLADRLLSRSVVTDRLGAGLSKSWSVCLMHARPTGSCIDACLPESAELFRATGKARIGRFERLMNSPYISSDRIAEHSSAHCQEAASMGYSPMCYQIQGALQPPASARALSSAPSSLSLAEVTEDQNLVGAHDRARGASPRGGGTCRTSKSHSRRMI